MHTSCAFLNGNATQATALLLPRSLDICPSCLHTGTQVVKQGSRLSFPGETGVGDGNAVFQAIAEGSVRCEVAR